MSFPIALPDINALHIFALHVLLCFGCSREGSRDFYVSICSINVG